MHPWQVSIELREVLSKEMEQLYGRLLYPNNGNLTVTVGATQVFSLITAFIGHGVLRVNCHLSRHYDCFMSQPLKSMGGFLYLSFKQCDFKVDWTEFRSKITSKDQNGHH